MQRGGRLNTLPGTLHLLSRVFILGKYWFLGGGVQKRKDGRASSDFDSLVSFRKKAEEHEVEQVLENREFSFYYYFLNIPKDHSAFSHTQTPGPPAPKQRDAERQRGDPHRFPGRWGLDSGGPGKETEGDQTLTPGSPGLDAPGQPPNPRPRSGLRGDQFSTFPLCASGALPKPRNPRFLGVRFHSPGHQLHPHLSDHPRFPPGEKEAPGHGNLACLFCPAQPPPKPGTNFACAAAPARVPTPGGMRAPLAGRAGRSASRAVPPAPLGRLGSRNRAACAPSGLLTRTAGRGSAGRLQFPNPHTT